MDAHTGKTLTAGKLLEEACNLAEALRRYGCRNDSKISLCSENNLSFFITVLASVFAGTVLVPLNNNYSSEELAHKFNLTEPRIIFISKRSYPKYLQMQKIMKFIEKVVVIDSDEHIDGVENVHEFIQNSLEGQLISPLKFTPFDGDGKKQLVFILCSSGTTGLPKGVMLSHFNVATRMIQARLMFYLLIFL